MPLTVAIKGLAIAAQRGSEYEVLLNHGMGHKGTLTILTRFLRPDPMDTRRWDPDRLGYIPVIPENEGEEVKLEQIGIWDLVNTDVTIGSEDGPLELWTRRLKETIAFDRPELHGRNCATGPASSTNFTVLHVREGHPGVSSITEALTLEDGHEPPKAVSLDVAYELRFSNINTFDIINASGRRIPLDTELDNVFVVVSNVGVEPDEEVANHHFHHYYDVVTQANADHTPIPHEDRFRIGNSADEVYDCVPPTTGP
jgi:hypothetical protein